MPLYCDNQRSIVLAKNSENHQYTKHIDVRYDYIWEKEEDGTIAVDSIPTDDMIADGLTKALTPAPMKVFIKQLGLRREELRYILGGRNTFCLFGSRNSLREWFRI